MFDSGILDYDFADLRPVCHRCNENNLSSIGGK